MFFDDYKQALAVIVDITAWVNQSHRDGAFDGSEGQKFAATLYQKADSLAVACSFAADCEFL